MTLAQKKTAKVVQRKKIKEVKELRRMSMMKRARKMMRGVIEL